MRKIALLSVLLGGLLVGCGSAEKIESAKSLSPDSLSVDQAKGIFKENDDVDGAFEEKKKIIIGNYRVAFMQGGVGFASEQKVEDINFGRINEKLYGRALLKGISEQEMQSIVEEAYQDLQKRLKAVGREVVLLNQLTNSDGYKELKKSNKNKVTMHGGIKYVVKNPKSLPLWFSMGDSMDSAGVAAAGNAFSMKNVGNMKSLSVDGDGVLLDLTTAVSIADVQGLRAKTFRSAKVRVKPRLIVKPTKLSLLTAKKTWVGTVPGPQGTLTLRENVSFNYGNDYAQIKTATGEAGGLWEDSEKTLDVTINADPKKFRGNVLQALKTFNASIAQFAKEYQ